MNRARFSKTGKTFDLNYYTVLLHGNVIFFPPVSAWGEVSMGKLYSFKPKLDSLTFRRMFKIVDEAQP